MRIATFLVASLYLQHFTFSICFGDTKGSSSASLKICREIMLAEDRKEFGSYLGSVKAVALHSGSEDGVTSFYWLT